MMNGFNDSFQSLVILYWNQPCCFKHQLYHFLHILTSYFDSKSPLSIFLKSSMEAIGRKLAMQIMKPDKSREITTLLDIDLKSSDIFKHPEKLYVGNSAWSNLRKALDEGDISQRQYKTFFEAVHYFCKRSLRYIKKSFH